MFVSIHMIVSVLQAEFDTKNLFYSEIFLICDAGTSGGICANPKSR